MSEKILVVDDNPVNRKILVSMLDREGYQPVEASDGWEALHQAALEDPDMILLDVMMPAMDGFEVCRELKSNPHFADTPILFLSALDQASDKVKGLEMGASDYISKPFHHIEVLARVRNSLRSRRQTRTLRRSKEAMRLYAGKLHGELMEAQALQKGFLPARRFRSGRLEAAWKQTPLREVGGEMPGVLRMDGMDALYLVDSGLSGMPGAMAALALAKAIHPQPGGILRPKLEGAPGFAPATPAQVLHALDRQFSFSEFGSLLGVLYAALDEASGRLRWASTGHPAPVLLRRGVRPSVLEGSIPAEGTTWQGGYRVGEADLGRGDRLFLHTDGLVHRASPEGKPFGLERMLQALERSSDSDLSAALETVEQAVLCHADGAPAAEDATWMLVEYR